VFHQRNQLRNLTLSNPAKDTSSSDVRDSGDRVSPAFPLFISSPLRPAHQSCCRQVPSSKESRERCTVARTLHRLTFHHNPLELNMLLSVMCPMAPVPHSSSLYLTQYPPLHPDSL
jgi:hypothetical protein